MVGSSEPNVKPEFDITILRTQVKVDDIHKRGDGLDLDALRSYRKALRTLHTLEIMAVNT